MIVRNLMNSVSRTLFLPCLFAFAASTYAAPVVQISTAPSVTQGSMFDIDVLITGADDLYAFQFDFNFNPSLLRVLSVTQGDLLPATGDTLPFPGAIDNTLGIVEVLADTLIASIPGATGDGILFTLHARALSAGTAVLSLSNEIYLDSALEDITAGVTTNPGEISIERRVVTVPEPATGLLLAVAVLAACARRRGQLPVARRI